MRLLLGGREGEVRGTSAEGVRAYREAGPAARHQHGGDRAGHELRELERQTQAQRQGEYTFTFSHTSDCCALRNVALSRLRSDMLY